MNIFSGFDKDFAEESAPAGTKRRRATNNTRATRAKGASDNFDSRSLEEEFEDRSRNELDLMILSILGFDNPKEIRDEIYESLLIMTNERLKKANTFRKKGK